MMNCGENAEDNRVMINNDLNREEIKAELYLLIVNFLKNCGNFESAQTLENELQKTISSLRLRQNGEIAQITFAEMSKEFWHIPQSFLLDSLIQTIKVLRNTPNSTYRGLSSLLSSRFPSTQRLNGKNLSVYPSHPHTNITCSIIKRSYFIPKKLDVDNIKETIMKHLRMKRQVLGHLSSTYCVIFDRTGKSIITGSDDTLIKIWKTTTCQLLATLRGHSGAICDLAISYNNKLLASASCDKTVMIWDTETAAHLCILHGHTNSLSSLRFCPRGINGNNYLISTGNDANLCIWTYKDEIFDQTPLKFNEKIKNGSQLICSSFSPGGKYLVVGSSDAKIYIYSFSDTIKKIAEYEKHEDRIDSVEFNHCGEKFLTASRDGQAKIWYPKSSTWLCISLALSHQPNIEEKYKIVNLTWSLNDERVIGSMNDHSIVIWSSQTGNILQSVQRHNDSVFVIECHPTLSNYFLTAGHDGNIILWNINSVSPCKVFLNKIEQEGFGAIFDAKFSPCGFYIAATDNTGNVLFLDVFQDNQFNAFPKEQFFQTDYKPITIVENVVYDEETGMLPHSMPPPYIVNEEGNTHDAIFQMTHLGRITDFSDKNLEKHGFIQKDLNINIIYEDKPRNQSIIFDSIYATMPITPLDTERWLSRVLVPSLSSFQIREYEITVNENYNHEVDFYRHIHENNNSQKQNDDERKNKLFSLKSRIIMNRSNRERNTEVIEPIVINDEPSHQISVADADPDFVHSDEASSVTTESSDTSECEFSESSKSSGKNIKRELCTRRKTYQLQSEHSETGSTTNEEPIYPHLVQHSGITIDWLTVEKPTYSPYFPQVGDIVVYHLVGHRIYCKHVINYNLFHINLNRQCYNKVSLKSTEVCRVNSVSFPPGYPYLCSVSLTKMDTSGTYSTGLNFNVQFTDVTNLDDFITLKKFYDESTRHNWKIGDRFKSFIDDRWWGGEITNIIPIDKRYPDSEFRSICVKWNSGELDTLSPWDIFPSDTEIDLSYHPDEIDWSPETIDEASQRIMAGFDTIQILPQFAEIEKFLAEKSSQTPFFTSYCKISRKISNRYYRRKKAIIWELRIIASNLSHLKPPNHLLQASKVLTQALILFIKDVAYDVMAIIDQISNENIADRESITSSMEDDVTRSKRTTNVPAEFKWIIEADQLLTYLTSLSVAKPFILPVELDEYPDYLSFVNTPMDFTTIKNKLSSGGYISPDQFVDDIKLILRNSKAYNTNRKSNIYSITLRLNNIFNKKLEELLPKWHNENMNSSTLLTRSKISSFLKRLDTTSKTNTTKESTTVCESTPIASRVRKRRRSSQTNTNSDVLLISGIQKQRKKVLVSGSSDSTPVIRTRSYELKKQSELYHDRSINSESSEIIENFSFIRHSKRRSNQNKKLTKSLQKNGKSKKIQKSKKQMNRSDTFEETSTIESEEFEELLGSRFDSKKYNLRSKKEDESSSSSRTRLRILK